MSSAPPAPDPGEELGRSSKTARRVYQLVSGRAVAGTFLKGKK